MHSILIIQTAFLGDVVLATPVIERLRRCYPDAEIDFLLRKGNESLLVGHPHLRRVLVRDKKGDGKLGSLRKMLKAVRAERYDLIVNLHRFLSSGILAGFGRAGQVCGFDKNPLSWRFDVKVPHVIAKVGEPVVHEVERNLSVVAHLTAGPADPMRLYPSEVDDAVVRKVLGRADVGERSEEALDSGNATKESGDTRPYYCIAPTSVWFTKQWPAARWVALMGRLDPSATVYLLGAPGDRAACEAMAVDAEHPRVEVLAGDLSLLQSAALMQGAVMNYVNDSAPLHLASAMNAPVTAVFLSTVPAFGFGPRNANGRVLETTAALDCRPCGLHGFRACPQGHFRCAEIEVE